MSYIIIYCFSAVKPAVLPGEKGKMDGTRQNYR